MRHDLRQLVASAIIPALMVFVGCSESNVQPTQDESDSSSDSIRGKSFTNSLESAGAMNLAAGEAVSSAAILRLFEHDPAQTPESGWMTLRGSSVTVTPQGNGDAGGETPALPLDGSATLRMSIAAGDSPELCDGAQFMAEFRISLTTGVASVVDEQHNLTAPVLRAITENEVTLCTEITSNFDGRITLGDFDLTFDGGAGLPTFRLRNLDSKDIGLLTPGELFNPDNTVGPGDTRIATVDDARSGEPITIRAGTNARGTLGSTTCPSVEGTNYVAVVEWNGTTLTCTAEQDPIEEGAGSDGGSATQVSIENLFGVAVAAPPTHTYSGIDYAVVGVLDSTMDSAPGSTDENSLFIDLASLGLESVEALHFATYSDSVADLADGVTIATLTLRFNNTSLTEIIPLVLGENTADWSYDRPEHTSRLGGVRHRKARVLYSFDTSLDSNSEYSGLVYAVTVNLDRPKTLTGIDLVMADADTMGERPDAGNTSILTKQTVPAITLVGPIPATDDETTTANDDTVIADPSDAETEDTMVDGEDDPVLVGTAAGQIVDGVTRLPLTGVQLLVDGGVGSGVTGSNGIYSIGDLSVGTHTLDATLPGFVTVSTTIVITANQEFETVFELFAEGTVTGTVVDAQTGDALPGVVVSVEGTAATTTTDGNGMFTINNAPEGQRTLNAVLPGYVPATVPATISPDQDAEVSIGLLSIGGGGAGVAVVLAWSDSPSDLDLHISGPDGGGGRFHIAFYSLNPVPHGSLDLDDVSSFGPETVTISPTPAGTYVAGVYQIWIHNFSGSPEFNVSDGVVTLFAGGMQFAQFQTRNASGDASLDIWRVIEFSIAEDGSVSNVNELETYVDGSSETEF